MEAYKYFQEYDTPPIGYLLREKYVNNWIRIHGLNSGKRYPDNKLEEKEALYRYSKVFNFFDQKAVIGYYTLYQNGVIPPYLVTLIDQNTFLESNISDDDEPYIVKTYAFIFSNNFPLNKLILDIISDNLDGRILFYFDNDGKQIYAPYDGGVDLFSKNLEDLSLIKQNFSSWLSKREDGL